MPPDRSREIHVVGDEEVVPAVAVIISKGCSRGPFGVAAQLGALGHVGKDAIAIVAIEHQPAKTPGRTNAAGRFSMMTAGPAVRCLRLLLISGLVPGVLNPAVE
jgi:hypothetical protein